MTAAAIIDFAALKRAKQATARAMQRDRGRHFDRAAGFARTRREIERHAIYKRAADSDDLSRWLVAWRWFNPWSKDPVGSVIEAARRMGRKHLSIAEAEAVIAEARRIPRRMKADALARWLGVTYAERQRLGLTRIGACDVGKRARTILRKRRARLALQHKRRKAGVRPRTEYLAQSLSRVRPWEAEGISRRTWERRQRARHAVSLVDTTRDIAAWAG